MASITSSVLGAGPMVAGFLGLANLRLRSASGVRGPLFGFVASVGMAWVLLLFGDHLMSSTCFHQGPYPAMILFIALAALATSYVAAAAICLFATSVLWFVIAWVPGLGFHDAQPGIAITTDWGMVS